MKCQTVIDRIPFLLDGRVSGAERGLLRKHLSDCQQCALRAYQIKRLRAGLRALSVRKPPPDLVVQLQVLASHQRLLQCRNSSLAAFWLYWRDRSHLWFENLMRPLALPVAGGLLSAVVLFSIVAPMYGIRDRYLIRDVPTILTTQAAVRSSTVSFGIVNHDIVVDVLVDGNGQMIDYSAPAGQVWQKNPQLRRRIANALLCTQFTPATVFGQPRSGILRITLRRNEVNVKG